MIEKITITRISVTDKKKDGTILKGKWGTFFRIGIQAEEYGEKWLNGFSNNMPTYEVGDEINVEIVKEDWQGEEQLKFRLAKEEELEIDKLKKKVAELEAEKDKETKTDPFPKEETIEMGEDKE